jgi:ADP-ribose pyrophosphatase
MDIQLDTIRLPDGREAKREIALHAPAAAVLPVDWDGALIFVRQYRHPLKDMALEIPAGILEDGETPEVCAARELEEEIGKKPGKLNKIFSFYTSIGFCTEQLTVFIAEDLIDSHQNLDEDEFVTIEKYTPEQAFDLIQNGGIVDAKTTAALLYYLNIIKKSI